MHCTGGIAIKDYVMGYYVMDINGKGGVLQDHLFTNTGFFLLHGDEAGTSVERPLPSDLEIMYAGQALGGQRKENGRK